MPWLIPSVIATATGTAILTVCYFYLYSLDHKKFLKIWAISWAVYFTRYVFLLVTLFWQKTPWLLIGNQLASLLSGVLLLYGTYLFINKKFPRIFTYLAVLGGLWIFVSILNNYSFLVMSLPTFSFLAGIYVWTGIVFLQSSQTEKKEIAIVGIGFILWGLHKVNYPFLQPVVWFAPWGYLFAAAIEFTVALGLLLVYFRKARNEITASEEKFRSLAESSRDYIMRYDRQGRHTYMNPAALAACGLSEGDIIGKTHLESGFPENLSKIWEEKITQVFETGKPSQTEFSWESANGQVCLDWRLTPEFDADNQVISVLGISRDITERKQAEESLRKSEERFKAIVNSTDDAIISKTLDGIIQSWNKGAERMFGYSPEEMIGQPMQELLPEDRKTEESDILSHISQGERIDHFETVRQCKDGSYRNVSFTISPMFDTQGRIFGVSQIARDITERKKAEEEKEVLQTQLSQAQKMEAIGTLAGGIAHDFNNILGAILGYTEMAYEDSLRNSVNPSDLNQVLKAGHRAKDLVKQILAFSRQADSQKIPLRPAALVKESIKLLRSSIPTTINIQQDVDSKTDLILADPTQIHQILINLCTNAFHAMEETGGTLSISLGNKTLAEQDLVSHPPIKPGNFIQLSIKDTGSGVAPEIKERIFDPYFTTKEAGKGTGMGLSIVHGIVKSYCGFITCHSERGAGTVFKICLPAVSDQIESETKEIEMTPGGTERILFIDDEEILTEMAQTMLERLGYTVSIRMSSLDALATFKNQPDAFDLVITDQTMPGMTGVDLARNMLQIRLDIPIILCTGYSSQVSKEKAESYGIKGFAMKPLARKDIGALIRKVLD